MRRRRSIRKKIFIFLASILLFFVLIKVVITVGSIFPTAARVVFHPGATLQTTNGKTNILLLGIGGGTHDGPDLTDTIIFASVDWKKNAITLVSIPRDLWVPDINSDSGVKKINEAYTIGEAQNQKKGLSYAKATVQEVVGEPIHYAIRLDFQGFIDGINQVGGVDVTVAHTLDDYNYPISGKEDDTCGHSPDELQAFNASLSASLTPDQDVFTFFPCRFKHIHFNPGPTHMDGETALEFARSRHAAGSEGTDFARSARQQLIIEAVRNKLITSAFLNPGKLLGLYTIIKGSIDTDITDTELGLFLDKLPQLKAAKITSYVVDYGDYTTGRPGLLQQAPVDGTYDFASVLIPRIGDGNFTEIQSYVSCLLIKNSCTIAVSPQPVNATTKK